MTDHLMHYVTRVGDVHVLSVNGKNVSMTAHPRTSSQPRRYEHEGVTITDTFDVTTYGSPFTTVILAAELARECMKQEKL